MNIETRLHALQLKVDPLEKFLAAFAGTLTEPLVYQPTDSPWAYRYAKPDIRHFCLLKAVRAVSAFNATIVLVQNSFPQEIAVLLRTMVECTTHIEYVLSGYDGDQTIDPEIKKYIDEYFADFSRSSSAAFRRPRIKQGRVHAAVGAELDNFTKQSARVVQAEKLLSNVYLTFSNYVHARYPEVMDMYGGTPGRFHLRGMKGTPKDIENLEAVETWVVTLSNALKMIVIKLKLHDLVRADAILLGWFRSS